MKAWLLNWLGVMSVGTFTAWRNEFFRIHNRQAEFIGELKAEHAKAISKVACDAYDDHMALKTQYDAAISELILDINSMRNAAPVAGRQDAKSGVRVIRNFREFRSTIEHRPKAAERTS